MKLGITYKRGKCFIYILTVISDSKNIHKTLIFFFLLYVFIQRLIMNLSGLLVTIYYHTINEKICGGLSIVSKHERMSFVKANTLIYTH
jgi:hypothetical protein